MKASLQQTAQSKIFYFKRRPENTAVIRSLPLSTSLSNDLLTDEAKDEMNRGGIPNLTQVCYDLFETFQQNKSGVYTALQFIPVMQRLSSIKSADAKKFMENPKTSHVLVQNNLLKVVLIYWEPGKMSSIHGHPSGGCVFKVLQGSVEEKRYTSDGTQQLLASSTFQKGGMAYIDDKLGYHAVGNPFGQSAISLHVYTPGFKS